MLRTNCQKLFDFLDKWYKLFQDENSTVNELLDKSFEEKFEEFGFYEDYDRLIDDELLSIQGISEYIEYSDYDVYDAASILYGHWYLYRYVIPDKGGIKDPKTRKWFIIVLKWMLMYADHALNIDYGDLVSCRIKTTIFETGLNKNADIEETLIIRTDGNIKYSLKKAEVIYLSVDSKKAKDFINRLSRCFVYGKDFFPESQYGSFEVEFTNSDNRKNRFFCGLRKLTDEEGNNMSKILRQLCGTDKLLAFDGKLKLIDELVLDYCSDNINEKLIVKREESSLTYIQDIGGRKISISIDDRDIKPLFDYLKPDDFIVSNTDSLRKYEVNLVLVNGQQLNYYGSYDVDSLSAKFISFLEGIESIIGNYSNGDIFRKSIYTNAKRRKGDYMVCKVMIKRLGKESYYLSVEDDLCVYDDVIVPGIEFDDNLYIGTVEEISFCKEKKLPYPLEIMKYIERRCVDEDYEFMDEMFY